MLKESILQISSQNVEKKTSWRPIKLPRAARLSVRASLRSEIDINQFESNIYTTVSFNGAIRFSPTHIATHSSLQAEWVAIQFPATFWGHVSLPRTCGQTLMWVP